MNNLDLYYEIFSVIDTICHHLIDGYCCVILARPFLDRRKKAWLTGGVYAVSMIFLDFMPWYINPMLAYTFGAMILFFSMYLTDKKYIAQKFFLGITFFCLRWQSYRIVIYLCNEVIGFATPFFRSTTTSEIFWLLWFIFTTFLGYGLLSFLFLSGAIKCVLWSYGRGREHMDGKELLLLSMPSLSGAVSYGVIRYYSYIYERDAGKSVYDLFGSHDFILSLFTLLSFAVIVVTTYVFRQWKTKQEEDRQRDIFSRQIQDLESHISETERLYRDIRRLRHDMGNHLMTLQHLYTQGESEAAEAYTTSLQEEIQNASSEIISGNPVTDVILSDRKKEMDEKGITFSCDFHYPNGSGINAFDISIILNNGLSNAIEAIERECSPTPHISLYSYRMKNMYVIEIANSYTGELKTDEQGGLPVTTKEDEGHGFGLSSIRHAAHKYLGDVAIGKEIYEQEDRCVLRVMLQTI
ncbi:MAG: GHKL domain-containing protein [Lachnospiraceae bacterium]|nr:GHKL domain-containing protein [Lachnospiraceae bacterium]